MSKRSRLRSCGKRCLRAVGKPAAFPSGRECLFSIGGAAVFHISIVRLSHDQAVDGEGHIPRRHQQAPYQDEAPDEAADDEVQHEQRGTAAQGAAARHDPDAHPMDAEGQAAEYYILLFTFLSEYVYTVRIVSLYNSLFVYNRCLEVFA